MHTRPRPREASWTRCACVCWRTATMLIDSFVPMRMKFTRRIQHTPKQSGQYHEDTRATPGKTPTRHVPKQLQPIAIGPASRSGPHCHCCPSLATFRQIACPSRPAYRFASSRMCLSFASWRPWRFRDSGDQSRRHNTSHGIHIAMRSPCWLAHSGHP